MVIVVCCGARSTGKNPACDVSYLQEKYFLAKYLQFYTSTKNFIKIRPKMSKRKPIKKKNFFYLLTLLTYSALLWEEDVSLNQESMAIAICVARLLPSLHHGRFLNLANTSELLLPRTMHSPHTMQCWRSQSENFVAQIFGVFAFGCDRAAHRCTPFQVTKLI